MELFDVAPDKMRYTPPEGDRTKTVATEDTEITELLELLVHSVFSVAK